MVGLKQTCSHKQHKTFAVFVLSRVLFLFSLNSSKSVYQANVCLGVNQRIPLKGIGFKYIEQSLKNETDKTASDVRIISVADKGLPDFRSVQRLFLIIK